MTSIRALVLTLALGLASGGLVHAQARVPSRSATSLDLPVRYPGMNVPAPAYLGDRLELQLRPPAARRATPLHAAPTATTRRARLDVAGVDALAAALGGATFESEFRAEVAPEREGEPDFTAFYIVALPPGTDLPAALARFRALPEVASADPIAVMPVSIMPNDSLWSQSVWFYQDTTPRHDNRAPEAWDVTTGDTTIVVGIVDTGVIPYHPDLGGTLAGGHGNLWINGAEANGTPGVDDDGNGYVDDVSGWDFVNLASGSGLQPGEDWRDEDADPNDYAGHGTAVAGLVGGLTDNSIGVAGTAWKVRIMPLRIGYSTLAAPLGEVNMQFAANAIRYATRTGCHVVNCSFSTLNQSGLDLAVTAATRAGIVVVAAAGNNGQSHYLGDREDVIAVAASNRDDIVPTFSNRGPWVDLAANGVDVISCWLARPTPDSLGRRAPAYKNALNGTSFAAPQVSGAVALLQADRRARGRKLLSPMGALLRLRETTDDISAFNTLFTSGWGTGRLNLFRALSDPPTSTATRSGARTVGAPVVVHFNDGRTRVWYATTSAKLLALDGLVGDTLALVDLPGAPAGALAMADCGPGFGVRMFVGLANNRIAAFDVFGTPVTGWPVVAPGGTVQMSLGPALGDLDGDGVPEVVCASGDGRIWAWHQNGTSVAGFPFATGALSSHPPALADLDGVPGHEIVFVSGDGLAHEIGSDGNELGGWPVSVGVNAAAPVIGRLGGDAAPLSIVFGSDTDLLALEPDGSTRWVVPLGATVVQDPALADLDGDGVDEIVLAEGSPSQLDVRDSSGAVLAARGFPVSLPLSPLGPIVAGPLVAGGRPGIAFGLSSGLTLVSDSAAVLPNFPKPGGAGISLTLDELDDDGATELAAGSGPDSSIFHYDAGPGTWAALARTWPTPRGNYARTGSRVGAPGQVSLDVVPPARITSLGPRDAGTHHLEIGWIAPGDDSVSGRATSYDVRISTAPIDAGNFVDATPVPVASPSIAGSLDSVDVQGLAEHTNYYFAIRTFDEAGNESGLSNVLAMATLGIRPAPVAGLQAIAVADAPGVFLQWIASGDDSLTGRAAYYRLKVGRSPAEALAFDAAPLPIHVDATVDPPAFEQAALHTLNPSTDYWFAVVAVDSAGQPSAPSNVVFAHTDPSRPGVLAGRVGVALAPRARPASVPIVIEWQGAAEAVGSEQSIRIYDLNGRELRELAVGVAGAGVANWDGRDSDGRRLPAGLYFARLLSGSFHASTRIVLLP